MARLLVDCNQLAVEIDAEIAVIHNWVRDQYRPKFPELESLVHHPIDYARVVKAIGNEVSGPLAAGASCTEPAASPVEPLAEHQEARLARIVVQWCASHVV